MPDLDDDPLEEFWDKALKPAPKTTTPLLKSDESKPLTLQELQDMSRAASEAQAVKTIAKIQKKADAIMTRAAEAARKKAAKGERESFVMKLVYEDDFKTWPPKIAGAPFPVLAPENLVGMGRVIYDRLKADGLPVKIAGSFNNYRDQEYRLMLAW